MGDITIIYYTANIENEKFEQKIIANLVQQAGDMPIISVSRKPMTLGTNICIGGQPICYSNSFKQLLIGLKAAQTKFCVAAESDVLYPPEYFQFTPPLDNQVYRYANVWVYWKRKRNFYRKPFSEGLQMCGREYWIKRLETVVSDDGNWEPMPNPLHIARSIFKTGITYSWTGNPSITFKTGQGLSQKTGCDIKNKLTELSYWGDRNTVYERMFR